MVGARFWKQSNGGVKFTLVAFFLLLTFMATSYYFDRRFDVSSFMWLPKEARVLEYRNEPGGECFVRFTLPKSNYKESNFKEIWSRNTSIKPGQIDTNSWHGNDKGFSYLLYRDPSSEIFIYQVQRALPATAAPGGSGPYPVPTKKSAPSVKGP